MLTVEPQSREARLWLVIIKPHRSTYADAAYCYRPSIAWSLSVCRSDTVVSPAETAHLIKMPFGLRTWVGPRNYVLDRNPDPPLEEAILRGKGRPIVKYRDTLR